MSLPEKIPAMLNSPSQESVRSALLAQQLLNIYGDEIDALHRHSQPRRLILLIYPAIMITGLLLASAGYGWGLRADHNWWMYLAGVTVAAIGMNSCFLLIHEATHGILDEHPHLNHLLGFLLGGMGFVAFSVYKVLHLKHHRHLGQPGDPDHYDNYTRSRLLYWIMQYLRLSLGTILYLFFMPSLAFRSGSPAERRHILLEYGILLPLYAWMLMNLSTSVLLAVWVVPFILANFLINVRALTQHAATDPNDELTASRTVRTSALVQFFLLSENLHLEHHLFPAMPSYNLGKVSQLIDTQLPRRITARSYSGFVARFIAASLRNDTRPIGMREG